MERETGQCHQTEAECQYEALWDGETVDQAYLFSLEPNYLHLVGSLIDQEVVEQSVMEIDGEERVFLKLKEKDEARKKTPLEEFTEGPEWC